MSDRRSAEARACAAVERLLGMSPAAGSTFEVLPDRQWVNNWGAVYGGYVAGVLVHALDRATPEGQQLSIAHVNFVSALRTLPARTTVEAVRRGRTASCLLARLEQDGRPAAIATGWTTAAIPGGPSRFDLPAPPARAPLEHPPRRAPCSSPASRSASPSCSSRSAR